MSSQLALEVMRILTDEDVEGLMGAGAPCDEYEAEAAAIAARVVRLRQSAAEASILDVVTDELEKSFGPFDSDQLRRRSETYRTVARHILKALNLSQAKG